jgi:GNAT superfamily N-acetyltransferase
MTGDGISGTRQIRAATPDDILSIRAILAAHGNDGPALFADIVGPYVRHLVDHHRAMVTEQGGAVVAFGATVDAGVAVHLADLFVLPDRLGEGIGRPLLTALFGAAERRTTCSSADPRALPLYVRAGMSPLWAALYLEGASATLPADPPSIEIEAADPARLAALEHAWTGADRAVDHVFWASQADADSFVVAERGEPVAICHARARQVSPARVVDRLLVRPGAEPVAATLAALRRTGRGEAVQAMVGGPNPTLRVLLDHGFLVVDRDQFMASDPGLVDPARLVPNPGML